MVNWRRYSPEQQLPAEKRVFIFHARRIQDALARLVRTGLRLLRNLYCSPRVRAIQFQQRPSARGYVDAIKSEKGD